MFMICYSTRRETIPVVLRLDDPSYPSYEPINVKPDGGGGGRGVEIWHFP